jgi:hypothetical protein
MQRNVATEVRLYVMWRSLVVLLLLLAIAGCEGKQASSGGMTDEERQALEEPLPPSQIVEEGRFASPDGILEAVLVTRATDATVATPTEIYLVSAGSKVVGEPPFRADHVLDISVSWRDKTSVVVQAKEARPFRQEISQDVVSKEGTRTTKLEYRIEKVDPTGRP